MDARLLFRYVVYVVFSSILTQITYVDDMHCTCVYSFYFIDTMKCKTVATTVDELLSNPNNVTFQESKNVRLHLFFLLVQPFQHIQSILHSKL